MTGLLASQGLRVSQVSVGESLRRTNPQYHCMRRESTAALMNPVPYKADYFGHKVHCDQNEKLAMYGVTHVCARDGYSGKVVAFVTMPVKNNLEIYEHLFRYNIQTVLLFFAMTQSLNRNMILTYGLWDQIRVDHGKEFYLMLFIQEVLAHLRRNVSRAPHMQSTSRQVYYFI